MNISAKFWVFWEDDWVELASSYSIQRLTIRFQLRGPDKCFRLTTVHARCSSLERLELWKDLENIENQSNSPWLVDGNFNTVVDDYPNKRQYILLIVLIFFIEWTKICRSCYTWWNERIKIDCIFKRLDIVLSNSWSYSLIVKCI